MDIYFLHSSLVTLWPFYICTICIFTFVFLPLYFYICIFTFVFFICIFTFAQFVQFCTVLLSTFFPHYSALFGPRDGMLGNFPNNPNNQDQRGYILNWTGLKTDFKLHALYHPFLGWKHKSKFSTSIALSCKLISSPWYSNWPNQNQAAPLLRRFQPQIFGGKKNRILFLSLVGIQETILRGGAMPHSSNGQP